MKAIIQNQIQELEIKLQEINKFLKNAPDGDLQIHMQDKVPYYCHRYKDEEGQLIQKYISKKKICFAKILEQKMYYLKVKPVIEKNLAVLKKSVAAYNSNKIKEIYHNLSPYRKELVTPIEVSVEEKILLWKNEKNEVNTSYPEYLRFETENGEMVRSKSEVIIANMLQRYSTQLLYKYERPLKLYDNDKEYTIYPDFTIINLQTGKITYWEHAGKMDDSKYASDFVWKTNLYIKNKIIPGDDLVCTYETALHPLMMNVIKIIINSLLG